MRRLIISILFTGFYFISFSQKDKCVSQDYPEPVLRDSIQKVFETNLRSAENKYQNDSTNDEYIIWYGRRLAYLGRYNEAIDIYTKGISLHPDNPRFYRHRGHRYITTRCFDKAIDDLKKAVDLVGDQIDEIEADGIPNAKNFPLGTLHTNIYYHLGLAYYLKGDYRDALLAYEKCLDIADNDDMMVATLNWLNLTLRKMGRTGLAEQRIKSVNPDIELIENQDYMDILLMYNSGNTSKIKEKINQQESLSNATLRYGLGAYYQFKGEKKKAKEIYQKVMAGNQWNSFGYIAAEAELAKMK